VLPVRDRSSGPTLVRGMLRHSGREPASLLDLTGRRCAELMPGENDVRQLAPGVYFCQRSDGLEKLLVLR
jgi:hypothetical protein